ncbi:glycosyltransferase family 4 protein [Daejeonella lutea]|uniref:Glycosyltransferase involved in cell wall bisynthesis n=1 Tax=Daejeonella lutea TaxID=572036 RepID=A0A1T5A0R5_9SPHI|nr:glycosyltransferase family 4 protein [Daejeonella lutea]SKB28253.1 Glycosyltransferase involved in cell wall bisynthesis [Daejeonella lutea]
MKIAYLSSYTPRECGIATFNYNLIRAINADNKDGSLNGFVVAMNDSDDLEEYAYPAEVKFTIRQEHQKDYIKAAEFINNSDVDACVIEHEFGIYGGESGVYLLPLISRLNKPLITVLHTVLREPSFMQQIIIREIAKQSSKIVVMSHKAVDFLRNIYYISEDKIQRIEHGVPDLEPVENNPVKKLPSFKNKKVLFTFGLISRNKGLETVIKALPAIVEKHPDVMYVVLGNTHPGVRKNSGEEYRDSLKKLAKSLNVEEHLTFINQFVSEEELHHYLTACDIYVTPYLNEAQITSGTLSYAVGAGAAVLSTPYWHAQELLQNGRGRLFDFKDFENLSESVNDLLDHPEKLAKLKETAYNYGLNLRWPAIGREYTALLKDSSALTVLKTKSRHIIDSEIIPEFNLTHVKRLTDDTGIVQHAKYGIPNLKEGYCLDDNARALIMALMAYEQNKSKEALDLLPIYLSYIQYMQMDDGNFRNFLSFRREYLDEVGSEDSFGRTIWALGYLINSAPNNSYREFAEELFQRSIPHFKDLQHLRGLANTIIGLSYYLQAHPYDEGLILQLKELTQPLVDVYENNKADNWHWFEDKLSYDNAILPLALLHSSQITGNERVMEIAYESIEFLDSLTLSKGYLSPVGSDGWYYRNGSMAIFDQQAIESMAMVLMYFKAYDVSGEKQFLSKMYLCYQWFLGENTLRLPLYDHETKGCCDGLQPGGLNRNQGAESTLAYFISHLLVLKGLELESFQGDDQKLKIITKGADSEAA